MDTQTKIATKLRVMELERNNFAHLIFYDSTDGFAKLAGHSAIFYSALRHLPTLARDLLGSRLFYEAHSLLALYVEAANEGLTPARLTTLLADTRHLKYQLQNLDNLHLLPTSDLPLITSYLTSLGLTLHPKKQYKQLASHGVPFLGTLVFPRTILPGPRLQQNARSAFRAFAEGHGSINSVTSYLGLLKHLNSKKFLKATFEELGWDYAD